MTQLPVYQDKSSDFTYSVVLESRKYTVRYTWNSRSEYWHFTITDEDGGVINGVKMVEKFPLLAAHRAQVVMEGDILVIPQVDYPTPLSYDNIATEWQVVHMSADEVLAWRAENGL